jgi:hypothetical protein
MHYKEFELQNAYTCEKHSSLFQIAVKKGFYNNIESTFFEIHVLILAP